MITILLTTLFQIGIDAPNRFNGYLLLGYVVLGGMAIAYILYLWSQQRNIERDLQVLEQVLNDDDADV